MVLGHNTQSGARSNRSVGQRAQPARAKQQAHAPAGGAMRQPASSASARDLIRLQQTAGNRAVSRMVEARGTPSQPIQTRLSVGRVDDPLEREADRMAGEALQHIPHSGATGHLPAPAQPQTHRAQRKNLTRQTVGLKGGDLDTDTSAAINRARSGGRPLDDRLSAQLGNALGADFRGVRVHTDVVSHTLSQTLGAQAFTTGRDIFFNAGAYNPGSVAGRQLIAHELTHVVQQGAAGPGAGQTATPSIQRKPITSVTGNTVAEYDSLGAYESDYESSHDTEATKDLGVSYYLVNARENGAPRPGAVAHAHVRENGTRIEGISIKRTPGPFGAQIVSPRDLSEASAKELRQEMESHPLSPVKLNNRRRVSKETGVWPAGSLPGAEDYNVATGTGKPRLDKIDVWYVGADGWVVYKTKTPKWLFDANTGEMIRDIYSSRGAAEHSNRKADPVWANNLRESTPAPLAPAAVAPAPALPVASSSPSKPKSPPKSVNLAATQRAAPAKKSPPAQSSAKRSKTAPSPSQLPTAVKSVAVSAAQPTAKQSTWSVGAYVVCGLTAVTALGVAVVARYLLQ